MAILTFDKAGVKASKAVKLDDAVFSVSVENHALLKQVYTAYLANGRENLSVVKKRGEVRGGGKKPWKQKGTGRARFGSSRNPIWRGGGIVFGPTGNENYSHSVNIKSKRLATRQALSLANVAGKVRVIEDIVSTGKTSELVLLLTKLEATRRTLIVVENKTDLLDRAARNLGNVKIVQASYVNVYDTLNADSIILTTAAAAALSTRLGGDK